MKPLIVALLIVAAALSTVDAQRTLTSYDAVLNALQTGQRVRVVTDYSKVVPPLGPAKSASDIGIWQWFNLPAIELGSRLSWGHSSLIQNYNYTELGGHERDPLGA